MLLYTGGRPLFQLCNDFSRRGSRGRGVAIDISIVMPAKGTWKKRIKKACEEAGTYSPEFDYVIDTLAGIMENRDKAQKQFKDSGSNPVVTHTNKAGATNIVKNPALVAVMDCDAQALAYWRDLGLTPAGLKKIRGDAAEAERESALTKALKEMSMNG